MKALVKAWLEEPGRGEYLFLAACVLLALAMILVSFAVAP